MPLTVKSHSLLDLLDSGIVLKYKFYYCSGMGRPTDQERIADETIIIHSSHEEWGWLTVVVGKYQHWLEEK